MSEKDVWSHTDNDGDTAYAYISTQDTFRLASPGSTSGSDLDRDAAERLITALAEHFQITQIVICGEMHPDRMSQCVRWPDHDGQHAGRGDRLNTHPTWVMWGGERPKTLPCPVKTRVSGIPCTLLLDHDGQHAWLGNPEPKVSVQELIQREHAVDRAHYTMQFNALGDLLRDAFRQRSSLHTGMLAQHTATHEMLAEQLGKIGHRTRATSHELGDVARLLTEIRDRLPEPPPPRCGDQSPTPGMTCELALGHDRRHGSGISSWPQKKCDDSSPYGGGDCVQPRGHSGNHVNGVQSWLQA